MARTLAALPAGSRVTDYISVGVITTFVPEAKVREVLRQTGRESIRERDLPAHVVVYHVMALALHMRSSAREVLRCLLEGVQWLLDPSVKVRVAGDSGISQARSRLGAEPMERLYREVAAPIAVDATRGAWYRKWRVVTLDGSTLDVADTAQNEGAFGKTESGRGRSAFPKLRFVALLENGTHVLWAGRMDRYDTGEATLADTVVESLRPGMLCLADRLFYGYKLWKKASDTGAGLLWRVKGDLRLDLEQRLPDGSFLSRVYPSTADRRRQCNAIQVRAIEYRLKGSKELYRLATTILDHTQAPAAELAALYHERWEIETSLDELKTHLRGAQIVLRSKTPELVRQEFFGLMLTHYAIRSLMHQAALKADQDPDRLSFVHTVHVVRRRLPRWIAIPPSEQESPV
jgi:hypothetical protein